MEQEVPPKHNNTALIVGVTGMVGVSLAEALKSPTALGGAWRVIGASRRPLPPWFPSATLDHFISFDAQNPTNTTQQLSPFATQITHLFYLALHASESEQTNVSVNAAMLHNVLHTLLHSPAASPPSLTHATIQTGSKHYMGPIFDPSLKPHLIPHAPPFVEHAPRQPFPNFYYAMEDVLKSYSPLITHSIHRSSLIIGASSFSIYNVLVTLGVYAAICKYEGVGFKYPGSKYTWEHFCDMSDSRVLAEQQIWAAVTEEAKNEAFNCTNGDVFMWKGLWRVLCEIFEVEFVEPLFDDEVEGFDWVGEMGGKGEVWREIVEKYGLYETKLEEITCFGAAHAVLHLEIQHVLSMNKSKEFGFFGYVDTLKSLKFWVTRLRDMKIIP